MAQVRIAVIGAGLIGRTHIAVLRSGNADYTLAGVADPSPAAAAEGKTLGYPVYATIEELLFGSTVGTGGRSRIDSRTSPGST